MKKIIVCMMVIAACMVMTTSTFAAGTCNDPHFIMFGVGHCNENGVNVRTGPGLDYKSVGFAYKNDRYNFYETMGEVNGTQNPDCLWNHVHGEHIGWMYKTYFTLDDVARAPELLFERA